MTAPASSIHKKLVFASAGCAGVLIAFGVIGMIMVRHLGLETPARPRYTTPLQSSAAIDSLSGYDFSDWLETDGSLQRLRCPATDTSQRVSPVPPADSLSPPIGFGDTFPPGSAARRLWEGLGTTVVIEPALGAATPVDSLPTGRELLAAVRERLSRRRRVGACVLLAALVEKVAALEASTRFDRVVGGAWLARDAADMVARDTVLQDLTGLDPARAAALFGVLDVEKRRLETLRGTIDAAGTSPVSADSLEAWAKDVRLPLPVRDAYVRAIGYGWVLDPPEMTFSVSPARRAALNTLLHAAVPEELWGTARAAVDVMQRNLAQRFQFAVNYRTFNQLQP